MAEEVSPQIVDAVANANFKNLAEHPGQYSSMIMGNAVQNQQNFSGLLNKSMGNSLSAMDRIGTTEALAIGGLNSGDIARLILALAAANKADVGST